jgi:hypothetical protein
MAVAKDEEMRVMGAILRELSKLDETAQRRVVAYVNERVMPPAGGDS